MPLFAQEKRHRKPARPAADNNHSFAAFRGDLGRIRAIAQILISDVAFKLRNADWFFHQLSAAGRFAWPGADPAYAGRQGQPFLDQLEGFPVFAVGQQADVALAIGFAGAGLRATCFLYAAS
jgi:hypothetical protein